MPPDVSIILVTYNLREHALECLESIQRHQSARYACDVWVVDNASTDGTCEAVRQQFPSVHVVENDTNLGFSFAANEAIRRSDGRYIFVLNPDTRVLAGCVDALVDFMERRPQVGAVGGKMRDGQGNLQPDLARRFPHALAMLAQESVVERIAPGLKRRLWAMPGWSPDRRMPVHVLSGAMMFIRRSALEAAGTFSEDFFMYYEDVELCWRLQRHGWPVWYLPEAEIVHLQNVSAARVPALARLALHRSERTYGRKCLRDPEAGFVRLCRIYDLCLRTLYALILSPFSAFKRNLVHQNVRLIYEWALPLAKY